ncbi:MAG: hypothetical protein NZ898_04890 [Myxococcota bacterium]|nr:hypothetical protein [Myxococcota bacterium]
MGGEMPFEGKAYPVVSFGAAARWIRFWNLGDEGMSVRNHNQFYAHLLVGAVGPPSRDGVTTSSGGPLGFPDQPYDPAQVGIRGGIHMVMWANSFATLDLELG